MNGFSNESHSVAPRRRFFAHIAAFSALGLSGAATRAASGQPTQPDGPNWPDTLQGRHKQVVDGIGVNSGLPLIFAYTFLVPNVSATAVIILRHDAVVMAFDHAIWEKYKVGESFKIIDPETNAPAKKNPFLRPKPGVLQIDDTAIDRLLARGVVFGSCNMALQNRAKKLAGNAGMKGEDAVKEWEASLIPGITNLPSGTWGINRAQEAGCTYCGGG